MSLKDEFGIPQNTWNAMIRRGVISCSVSRQEEILTCLKQKKDAGLSHAEAVKLTSIEMKVSERWIYEIINRYH